MSEKSVFQNDLKVDLHDVDFNGVCRASSLLRYVQTAAQDQLTANGMSYDELMERGVAFIVSKMKLEVYSPIHTYDRLQAVTYPCESKGFSFIRSYELKRDGLTVARALSVCALMDVKNHTIVRVTDFELGLTPLPVPTDISTPHFACPHEMELCGKYTVNYADLDQNNHLNNTRYADLISNFLPLKGKRVASIVISYLNEARFGEELSVYRKELDGKIYIRAVRADGKVNCESEVTLTEI